MPPAGQKKARPRVGDDDPLGLTPLVGRYFEAMRMKNFSKWTERVHEHHLQVFVGWCGERGIVRASEVTRPIVQQYQRAVFHQRKKDGAPLRFSTQLVRMRVVSKFFHWATRENLIEYNPATDLDLPRVPKRLPRFVLTAEEVDRIMTQPDVTDAIGVRDRAILEVFYSTGIRRTELLNLKLYDLDLDGGTVVVREGKGMKDRTIPIGERAIAWLQKYLADVRPWFASEPDLGFVFLTHRGLHVSRNYLTKMVHDYIEAAGIGKRGACHMFRHAMATQMLENGADIRFIQQMLGHSNLETTEVYTHVSIRKLHEIYNATHPAARLAPHEKTKKRIGEEPEIDFAGMLEHVDIETARVAASEGERRYEKQGGSYALKVLRETARTKKKS